MTMTSRASPSVVFRSFVGDAIVGIRPIQFDTRRNRNSDTMNVDRNPRPRGPIFSSTWSCSASITVSIIICQFDVGTTLRLRVASQPMKRTTIIEIHVITSVCELKVNPAICTASRTPISCITSTSLGGTPHLTSRNRHQRFRLSARIACTISCTIIIACIRRKPPTAAKK